MTLSRTLMIALGLAGSAMGCHRDNNRTTTPNTQQASVSMDGRPCDDPTFGTTINGTTQTGDPICDGTPRPSPEPPPPTGDWDI